MVSSSLTTLLTLSTLTLAVPHNKHFSFHYPHGSGIGHGSGTGRFPRPTGGFPMNGTEGGPFGNGTEAGSGARSGSLQVMTATVVPVPEGSGVADASKGSEDFSSAAGINQGQASTSVADATAPAAGGAGGSGDMCTTVTTTATSVQYVTVTAGAGEGEGSGKPSEAADASVSIPAGFEAPESSVTLASSAVPSVSAGAFYGGGHSFSYGGGFGGQSSAAPATTLATSYGGGYSASASSAAPTSSASGSTSSTTPTIPSTGGSGGKKGLSYNTASLLSAFDGTGMSWAYNWADGAGGSMPSGVEYVPMCWGASSGSGFAEKAAGASHVLSFNEPDLPAQSNMDPQTAAENHIKYVNPLSGSAQIGSPAITNGAGSSPLMGIDWLNAFFKACGGQCEVDFVAFHWYDSSKNFEYFKSHVNDVVKAASDNGISKVWLTEFGTTDGDSPDFIQQATEFLDSTDAVERYAYFMVDNILEQGGSLSTAGKAYAG